MADNLNTKSTKSTEKNKITNAVNRTTSETMRLGEPEKSVNHPTSLCTSTTKERKKTPAFQITSVTVGPRVSNDGGDDSADDLDESHTDDISDVIDNSRITDIENETPSYSEDTFSKEEVFFNASNASLGTAPVIPTSSQYGLAIVGPEGGSNPQNPVVTCSNNVTNSVEVNTTSVSDPGNGTINIVNSVKPNETDMRDVHTHTARNERFKVVKIESTEPFKRGRWMCMDYLDHSMVQQQSQQAIIVKASEQSDAHTGSVQYVGPDSGVVLMDGLGVDHPSEHQNIPSGLEHHQSPSLVQNVSNLTASQSVPTGYSTSVSPGQTLQQMSMGMMQQSVQIGNDMTSHAQSMSQVPILGMVQQQPPTMGQSLPPQQMQNLLQGYQQSGYYPSTQHLASQASSMPVQNQPLVTSTAQPLPGSMGMTAPQQHLMAQPHYQTQLPSQQYQQTSQHLQQPQQTLSQPSQGMQTGPQPVQLAQPIQVSQALPNQQIQVQVSQPMQPQALQVQVSQPMQAQSVQPSQSMQVPSQSVPVQSSQSMQIPSHLQNQSQPVQVPHHIQTQSQPVQIPQMQNVQVTAIPGQSQSMSVPQMQAQPQSIQVSQPMQSQSQPMQNQPQSMQGQSQPIQNQSQQMQTQPMQAQPLQQQQIQIQSQVSQQMHTQSQPVQMTQMQSQSQPVQGPQQVQQTSQSVQIPTQMQPQSQHVQHIQQVQVPQMQTQSQSMQVPQMQTQAQPVQVQHQMQAQSQPMPVTSQMQTQSQQMAPQLQHTQPVSVSQHMPVQSLPVSQPIQSQPMGIQVQQVAQQPLQQLHVVGMPQPMMTPSSMSGMPTTPLPPGYVTAPSGVGGGVVEMAMHPEPVQESSVGMPQDKVVVGEVVQPGPAGDDNAGPAANEEPESASSTSAVAIDNKIEQAMDLVKSHLMFAVREEVEVLKERIAELMERINQLELENTILKQHASQETLAQLGSSKGTVAATQGQQQQQQPTPQGQASLSQGQQAQPPAPQVAPTAAANNPTPMV